VTATLREKGAETINRKGIPHGSVIAPWLASMLYLDELDRELEARGLAFVRYADDCTIFCRSRKAAKRIKRNVIKFVENVMECPVNRDKTKVVPVESLAMLGLYRADGRWRLDRRKERAACGAFLATLRELNGEDDLWNIQTAVQKFEGFLNHYRRIPDLANSKVPELERWMLRKLEESTSGNGDETIGQRPEATANEGKEELARTQ
jgi:hypothetical protein